jgi:signal-transduction protein with cAMP-binding, CBS, and nucleotidyltransferase domain
MDKPLRRPEEILACRTLARMLGPAPRTVWSVGPADSVMAALQIMADRNIGLLVVLDKGRLVGVLSERDCARRAVLAKKPLDSTPVADIMVRDVVTVDLSRTFAECLRLMHERGFRHLPVLSDGKVIAVLSVRDLMSEAVDHHAKVIAELERERLTIFTSPV